MTNPTEPAPKVEQPAPKAEQPAPKAEQPAPKAEQPARVEKTDAQWREQLTEEQYYVCRHSGTERPFTGEYWDHEAPGTYSCICCDTPLFSSESKFQSHCGWPSYSAPLTADVVSEHPDHSHGMRRIEVRCTTCDAHLGHVFPDGPPPTGLRYCINSVCLTFTPENN